MFSRTLLAVTCSLPLVSGRGLVGITGGKVRSGNYYCGECDMPIDPVLLERALIILCIVILGFMIVFCCRCWPHFSRVCLKKEPIPEKPMTNGRRKSSARPSQGNIKVPRVHVIPTIEQQMQQHHRQARKEQNKALSPKGHLGRIAKDGHRPQDGHRPSDAGHHHQGHRPENHQQNDGTRRSIDVHRRSVDAQHVQDVRRSPGGDKLTIQRQPIVDVSRLQDLRSFQELQQPLHVQVNHPGHGGHQYHFEAIRFPPQMSQEQCQYHWDQMMSNSRSRPKSRSSRPDSSFYSYDDLNVSRLNVPNGDLEVRMDSNPRRYSSYV